VSEKTSVLFVCLGNIVRSPLAEHLFIQKTKDEGVADGFRVDSAGTAGYHIGESPDRRMREVAAENGLLYDGRARQFSVADFDAFDWIIAMDSSNREDILRLARSEQDRARVRLMRDFDPDAGPDASVPDPYYGGIEGFYHVYEIVQRATAGLYAHIRSGESTA
jgi:protein-tyrosine phosphatase